MHQQSEDVQGLLKASMQIMEHMNESGGDAEQVQGIRQALKEASGRLSSGGSNADGAFVEAERMVSDMLQQERSTYEAATGGSPDAFEAKSLDDQLHEEHSYHEKVDYKSLQKVQENLAKIRSLSQQ